MSLPPVAVVVSGTMKKRKSTNSPWQGRTSNKTKQQLWSPETVAAVF